MELPVEMHILDHSSKYSTNTNRNIIFISETNLLICLKGGYNAEDRGGSGGHEEGDDGFGSEHLTKKTGMW